jgi:hypothetical protein
MFRQGDVLIVPVAALPEGAEPIGSPDERRGWPVVLAYGEATGHAHAIRDGRIQEYRWTGSLDGARESRFIEVIEPCTVSHEEHAPIPLPQGLYRIVAQREFVGPADGQSGRRTDDWQWRTRLVAD